MVLKRIDDRGSPAASNRSLAYLSKFFGWCVDEDLLVANPATRVRPFSNLTSRDRVLGMEEIRAVWLTLKDFPGLFGPLLKVLLLTGQRRSEVAGLRWEELEGLDRGGYLAPSRGTDKEWSVASRASGARGSGSSSRVTAHRIACVYRDKRNCRIRF
jgi:integrase